MKKKQPKPEIADGLIETLWLSYCKRAYVTPLEPGTPQYNAMRNCFFSGAGGIVIAMDHVCSSGDERAIEFTKKSVLIELAVHFEKSEQELSQQIAERN